MGDGLNTDDYKSIKMGASSNPNALRLATLQDKKKTLEETIAKRNQELRQLCLKEAELTGVTPTEIPSETGDSPPNRRKVGTSYQLNFINNANTEDESVSTLEVQLQLHAKMAEAAIGLANEANSSKTLRRQHMSEYEHHRTQYNILQEKLNQLQNVQQSPSPNNTHQHKQKKKPRPPDQDDAVSVNLNVNDVFGKSVLRHSMRSLQHPLYSSESNEYKFSSHPKLTYRNSDDNLYIENAQHMKNEDALISNFYKLNLSKGPDQLDNIDSTHNIVQYVPSPTSNIPVYQQYIQYPKPPSHIIHQSPSQMVSSGNYDINIHSDYHQHKIPHSNTQGQIHKNLLTLSNQKISYMPSTPTQYLYGHSYNTEQPRSYNPLQIQPHQQYEHDVMTSGLGGFWKKKENGEMTWCNANFDNVWQRDKRCGSLDRRKNKRLHKRISPNVDVKCATLSSVPIQNEPNRNIMVQMQQQSPFRNRQDNCPLVRTQSLGSVGVQTLDSVWPSDDNSSCGSDTHSFNDSNPNARKQKQKEWYETSLDDPVLTAPRTPRSLSTIPSILPDVKYTNVPLTNYMSSQIPKCVLEIPAESNPSPKMTETNIELFNNNIPKNCTIVTAGHCKPYHEETKPFEMSDFYKYSTKFKKSPSKDTPGGIIQKGIYQPLQPMTCQPFTPVTNSNCNMGMVLDNTMTIPNQNVNTNSQDFPQEINAWYKNEDQNDNTNKDCSHSTATLV